MNSILEIRCIVAIVVGVPLGLFLLKYLYSRYKTDIFLSLKNKRVVITGGSSGIGLSLAKLAYRYGSHVTIIARNIEYLQKAEEEISIQNCYSRGEVKCLSADVTIDYQSLENQLKSLIGNTDILINCAGKAIARTFHEMQPEDIESQIRVNYIGAAHVTRVLLPAMLESKTPHGIVFVSSVAGQIGIYGYGAYSASKFALRGLAECLRMEVSNHGVSVTLAFPADTQTPGFEIEQIGKPTITKLLSSAGGLLSPDVVARSIMQSALRGDFFSSIGIDGWAVTQLTQGMCLPQSFLDVIYLIFLSPLLRLVAIGYGLWMRFIIYKDS